MKLKVTAPIRISLFGGGSDVGEFANKHGGLCINMAIDIKQEFIFDMESTKMDIPENASPNFYKTFMDEFDIYPGIQQKFNGFIHGGLGSSASAAVCLVAGLSRLKGEKLSKMQIAKKAWNIEVNKIGLFGGKQDQFCSALGGFNFMEFKNGIKPTRFRVGVAETIADHILLFNTGIRRSDEKLQENLKEIDDNQLDALSMIKATARLAYPLIVDSDIKSLGKLLDASWHHKKRSNNVTNKEIDNIYKEAIGLGALGGKLCGSGGGGYMIFLAPEDKHKNLINNLSAEHVDFNIDWKGVEVTEI